MDITNETSRKLYWLRQGECDCTHKTNGLSSQEIHRLRQILKREDKEKKRRKKMRSSGERKHLN